MGRRSSVAPVAVGRDAKAYKVVLAWAGEPIVPLVGKVTDESVLGWASMTRRRYLARGFFLKRSALLNMLDANFIDPLVNPRASARAEKAIMMLSDDPPEA